ncbi:MAG: sugar phosphate isomerase/epimerase [Puniceicoccales bacterium]|jgi:sugar phosphate isomerase/epimerase|nr:sugar phosphate isomerase/epimerase [Puniceicoccales bacterium]
MTTSSSTRRHFLTAAAGSVAGAAITAAAAPFAGTARASASAPSQKPAAGAPPRRFKLGIATYSYWHFTPRKFPIEGVIDKAAALGVEGVDVLHRQLENEQNDYLQRIKRHAFLNGVDLICLSMHQNFVSQDAERRKKQIAHTLHCLEIAARLGIPSMRINAGRWGTIKSFDELMKNRGIEPLPAGVTDEDGFAQAIDGIRQCLARAAELGVILALENHWGLSGTPEGMLRIHDAVNSPWLKLLPDTGNFLEDPYDKLAKVFPKACYVQAKTYFGGGEWYSLDLDYKRIVRQLRAADYCGYIGIEFEGKAPADEGVPKSVQLLRDAM